MGRVQASTASCMGGGIVGRFFRLRAAPGAEPPARAVAPATVDALAARANRADNGQPPMGLLRAEQNARPPVCVDVERARGLREWRGFPRDKRGGAHPASFGCASS